MTIARLIAYAPNGPSLGPLPNPSDVAVGYPLNDMGALTLSYAPDAARSDLLGRPVELAVEVSSDQGVTWVEPPSSRFLYLRDGRDPVEVADPLQGEAAAYLLRLQKALVGFAGLNAEGVRSFTNASPGKILADLFSAAQGRGAMEGVSWDFTAAADSSGRAWPEAVAAIGYDPGADLLSVLTGLAELALVDFRTQGRTVQVYVAESAGGMAADRTAGATPVTLRRGRDLTEGPFRRTWEALADTALVKGDNNATREVANAAATKPWGRQETYVTASGSSDQGTLQVIGDAALELTAAERTEHTFGLAFGTAQGAPLPFRDYAPGEWVAVSLDGTQAPQRMRVRQVTLTLEDTGTVGGNVVLNDRFLEGDVLTARRLNRLTGGATTGGTGTTPTSGNPGGGGGVGNDILAPAKPAGVTVTSAAYIESDGRARAQVSLDWIEVTTNADGTATSDVVGYEVRETPGDASDPATPPSWSMRASTVDSVWTNSPYDPGGRWSYQVRALDGVFNRSAWSDPVAVVMAHDTQAPPELSAPTVTSRLGVAQVTWDGLTATGQPLPLDFREASVHVSDSGATFAPTAATEVGRLPFRGVIATPGLELGTYWVRLVPHDTSGNAGPPSTAARFTVDPPAVSPAVAVIGFPDGLGLQLAEAPEAGARVQYHLSDDQDAGLDFVPSPATAVGAETTAGVLVVDALPDGSPLTEGVAYYARAVAINGIGSAAPGPAGVGMLNRSAVRELLVATLRTGYVLTGRIDIGQAYIDADAGIGIPNPDGSFSVIPFNGDPIRILAEVIATTLTVQGIATFLGLMRVQLRVALADGISAPSEPPTVVSSWPSVGLAIADGDVPQALAYDSPSDQYVVAVETPGAEYVRVMSAPRTGGSLTEVARTPIGNFREIRAVRGVAVAGGRYWLLCTSHSDASVGWKLVGISTSDSTDVITRDLATPNFSFGSRSFEYRPALGINEDASSLLLCFVETSSSRNSRAVRVEAYRASDGSRGNSFFIQGNVDSDVTNLAWVGQGPYASGGQRVIVQPTGGSGRVWSGSVAQPTRQGAEDFPRADLAVITGMCWDGTRLQALTAGHRIAAHARARTTAQEVTVGYTWAGSAPDGATVETNLGPTRTALIGARAQILVTTPTPPEAAQGETSKANRAAVYALTGGAQRRQIVLGRGARTTTLDVFTSTGRTPAATGVFDSSPADVVPDRGATDPEKRWVLRGSGYARVGDLEVAPSGVMAVGREAGAAIRADARLNAAAFAAPATDQTLPNGPFAQVTITGAEPYTSPLVTRSGSVVTVLEAGLWEVGVSVRIASPGGTTASRLIVIVETASGDVGTAERWLFEERSGVGQPVFCARTRVVPLPADTRLRMCAQQVSGGSLSILNVAGRNPAELTLRRVG